MLDTNYEQRVALPNTQLKEIVVEALALLYLFGALSMSRAEEGAISAKQATVMPSADADKVSEYVLKDHPYKKWKLFPGTKKLHKGGDPHGTLITTYVNHVALDSIKKKTMFAEGSMIVKENYTADKMMVALTTMYKVKGFNPEAGDWFWMSNAPDDKVQASSTVNGCIDYHAKAKATDYVLTKIPKRAILRVRLVGARVRAIAPVCTGRYRARRYIPVTGNTGTYLAAGSEKSL